MEANQTEVRYYTESLWKMKWTLTIDFPEKCATVNSVFCGPVLRQNSFYLLNDPLVYINIAFKQFI